MGRHKAGIEGGSGAMNCKGWLTHITRDIRSMSKGKAGLFSKASSRFDKKKWSKRVRGYFKSQTKTIL
ncbi:MAG: hypothetical protein H7X88_01720 [Gloeobacteraceae cyanobacterium ES-bin-316]|nr:hypothetical protein [Ferruginibacter sp.]